MVFMPPDLTSEDWMILLISGFFGIMLADMFYLRALQLIGAGLTGITGSLYSPFVVFLSFFYLSERLNGWQIFGMILVMVGVAVISLRKKSLAIAHPPFIGFVFAAMAVFVPRWESLLLNPLPPNCRFSGLFLSVPSVD